MTQNWWQIHCTVSDEKIEETVQLFEQLDALSITQLNAGEDDYYDLAHPAQPGWQLQKITGLFGEDFSTDAALLQLKVALGDSVAVELEELAEQDWEKAWLDQYKPVQINDKLWIIPSWDEHEPANSISIRIDPGLAFGTGTHPTTRLCLAAISTLSPPALTALDYGCGSGILAIAAAKFGAKTVDAVDIDPKAEQVTQDNATKNKVDTELTVVPAEAAHKRTYELVIANILAGALVELSPVLKQTVAPGGTLLLSGILAAQEQSVRAAYNDDFAISAVYEENWVLLTCQKTT